MVRVTATTGKRGKMVMRCNESTGCSKKEDNTQMLCLRLSNQHVKRRYLEK